MTVDKTFGERLAVLEEQMNSLLKDREHRDEQLENIESLLQNLQQEISRYKGFIGGVLFVFTSVAAFIKTFPYIKNFFTHQ